MDILNRVTDYLSSRTGSEPTVDLDDIVRRGERHIRKQRWMSAAAGAAGMLVFVMVGTVAFNTADPTTPGESTNVAGPGAEEVGADGPAFEGDVGDRAFPATTTAFAGEGGFSRGGFGADSAGAAEFAIAETTDASLSGYGYGGAAIPAVDTLPTVLAGNPLSVDWQTSESELGWVQNIVEHNGRFYTLSSAPGTTYEDFGFGNVPQSIYVSDDGVTWMANDTPDGMHASSLAVGGDAIYVLGTTPGTAESTGQIAGSTDGGASWSIIDLPLTVTPPTEFGRIQFQDTSGYVAAGEAGVVAVFNTMYQVDYWGVIPIELHDRTKDRWPQATQDGVVLYDYSAIQELQIECDQALAAAGYPAYESEDDYPPECLEAWNYEGGGDIIWSETWAELGLADGGVGGSEMFYSADGVNFERIESPFGPSSRLSVFEATNDGFTAFEVDENTGAFRQWVSTDGRSWTQSESAAPVQWSQAAGAVPGGFAVVGQANTTDGFYKTVVAVTADQGDSWQAYEVPGVDGGGEFYEQFASGVVIGSDGVFVAVSSFSYNEETGEESFNMGLYWTVDFENWTEIAMPENLEPYAEVRGLAVAGDLIRFDITSYEEDGQHTQTYSGVIGG